MNVSCRWLGLVLLLPLFAIGCANDTAPPRDKTPDKEAKIKAALDQLDPDDRKLAEARGSSAPSRPRTGSARWASRSS